ncbi:hypothetical protein G7046_g3785 [Stylonectria norvegica]|nr:hypothetical protein G7046_g3785 [Stylonectria norvegica]
MAPDEPPALSKRHSRVRSFFMMNPFRSEPRGQQLVTENAARTSDLTDQSTIPKPGDAPYPALKAWQFDIKETPSCEHVSWHQCHAPACQDRVLSEEVWVCQKHLDGGYYDKDDPPGFVDCPAP